MVFQVMCYAAERSVERPVSEMWHNQIFTQKYLWWVFSTPKNHKYLYIAYINFLEPACYKG